MRIVAREVVAGAVLLAVISAVTFLLLRLSSGDVARRLLGPLATEEQVRFKTQELGLDRPAAVQFADWAGRVLHGDFGRSWVSGNDVAALVSERLAVTLTLVIGATILSVIVATLLGSLAAQRGGWLDRLVQVLALLGFAVPGFLVALGVVNVFAIRLGWFPATGYIPLQKDVLGWATTAALPIVSLAIGLLAAVAQQLRNSMREQLRQDYVRVLRSQGLPESRVIYRHVLRNAAIPATAVLAVQTVGLLGGAVIVEVVFAIPGLGQIATSATRAGDLPVVMAIVIAMTAVVVLVNLVITLVQTWLNPRARLA